MRRKAIIMGMPVVVSIVDDFAKGNDIDEVFSYLRGIDERFSTYNDRSEMTKINLGFIDAFHYSSEMKEILSLSEQTKIETNGFFNIERNFKIDPSGIVKGYAITKAAYKLRKKGYSNFYIEIAGDIEVAGHNNKNEKWSVGIQNPFNTDEIIKIVKVTNCGIATSGNYRNGLHIYDPKSGIVVDEIKSMSIIGKSAYDADRFATAAFAMGEKGLEFIEKKAGLEGFMVTSDHRGHMTSGFDKFQIHKHDIN